MLALLGSALAPAWAQTGRLDTARHVLPSVEVQARRPERFAVGSRVHTLDSAALAPYRTGTLAEVLTARLPILIKSYGPGQLSTISLRGTGAVHTAVLWNGFNVALPTLGQNDFALLTAGANARVDVQPGPASGLYGTGAIGGTVLLTSPVRWGAGPQAAVQAEAGSFGLRAGSAEAGYSNARVALRTSATFRTAQNDFPYQLPGGGQLRQQNAALRHQASLSQDVQWRVGQAGQLQAALWLTDAHRQIQPAIGTTNNNARQRDQSRRVLLGYQRGTARHESVLRVAWFEDVLNYQTDQFLSASRVRTTQAQASHTWQLAPAFSLRVGAEAQHFAARLQAYGGAVSENRYAGYALLRYDPWPRLRLSANLRQALLPGRRPPLAPVLGAEWQAVQGAAHQLLLKANYARGYRAPTLNERYYQPGGDPNLKPESSRGYEAGLRHQWQLSRTRPRSLHTELTAYRQRVDDWVMWWPKPGETFVSARNLRQVLTQGLEASTELGWQTAAAQLTARLHYAYTQANKTRVYADDPAPTTRQLFYVPLHSAAVTLDARRHGWEGGATGTFTGYRYTEESGPNYLPGYALLDARLGYTLRLPRAPYAATLLAQGHNLLNQRYQSYLYRAMPGRWAQLSLRLAWH